MKLYGYWRSGTSYRVRIAIALKGAEVEQVPVNLLSGEHRDEAFRRINPQGLVPALILDDGQILTQSPAIIEYLDETLPGPKLLPGDAAGRARVRQMAALIGCDIHPLQNLRVLKYLQDPLGHEQEEAHGWAANWITVGFDALSDLVRRGGPARFLAGDEPTAADCYLVPQLYAARRFGVNIERFPELLAIEAALLALPGVDAAHPDRQPGAPGTGA